MVGRGSRVRGDLDRTLGGHYQRAMRLLYREKGHHIAKKIYMLTTHRGRRQDHECIRGTALLSTVARPEVHLIVTDRDRAGIRIGGRVPHLIDHGGLTGVLVARCREVSAWLK